VSVTVANPFPHLLAAWLQPLASLTTSHPRSIYYIYNDVDDSHEKASTSPRSIDFATAGLSGRGLLLSSGTSRIKRNPADAWIEAVLKHVSASPYR
jgi:hypothetical protein